MPSTTRVVDGIEYGPVTVVRNTDGTLERVKEDLQARIANETQERIHARLAAQERSRQRQIVDNKRSRERYNARKAKQAIQSIS